MTDLFLSGGTVLDPLERGERLGDVFCSGGRLSAAPAKGALKVDCTGCYVTPGLIDLHLHLYTKGSCLGVPADLAMLPNGVTTGVDAGTAGVWNFDACRAVNRGQYADVYYLVNVASTGLISDDLVEDTAPEHYDTEALRRLFLRERDRLLGLKIKMGKPAPPAGGSSLCRKPFRWRGPWASLWSSMSPIPARLWTRSRTASARGTSSAMSSRERGRPSFSKMVPSGKASAGPGKEVSSLKPATETAILT